MAKVKPSPGCPSATSTSYYYAKSRHCPVGLPAPRTECPPTGFSLLSGPPRFSDSKESRSQALRSPGPPEPSRGSECRPGCNMHLSGLFPPPSALSAIWDLTPGPNLGTEFPRKMAPGAPGPQ